MMQLPFTKMHGLGNNYIYVDGFQVELEEEQLPELAKQVSNPHTGIGSDGLILLLPSEVAQVKMRIFNKDGSEAMNCGNGLRCIAKLATDLKYVHSSEFKIETKSGVVQATVHLQNGIVNSVAIDMGEPILTRREIPMQATEEYQHDHVIMEPFEVNGTQLRATAVSMGNPHVIFYEQKIQQAPLYELGPIIEKDIRFLEGVNVEFVEIINEQEINFRVWERGSGVTQACGTGACAAVVASVLNEFVSQGKPITVHLDGGDLEITWEESGNVTMQGPAVTIATGIFYLSM
ncbi:diaminopimelate epimerase [Halalkalibacillus halophilus]|uniref:diaminopimelate epimerase n=1 Tax=Halalkalibacillus halophilus TaxID=392827 RepID=UPI000405D234|nr:diaminopimelate epimerase [Halalkalibacillus halophilus]